MPQESKLHLKERPTLGYFQKYVADMVMERGFENETVPELFMLLLEECGQIAKAIRKSVGVKTGIGSEEHRVAEEIADVFIYLLDICNHLDIDLEEAFRAKEELSKQRTWT